MCRNFTNSLIFQIKSLQNSPRSYIINSVVTLIAVKREVAADTAGFPRSECHVKILAASHCTNYMPVQQADRVIQAFRDKS